MAKPVIRRRKKKDKNNEHICMTEIVAGVGNDRSLLGQGLAP